MHGDFIVLFYIIHWLDSGEDLNMIVMWHILYPVVALACDLDLLEDEKKKTNAWLHLVRLKWWKWHTQEQLSVTVKIKLGGNCCQATWLCSSVYMDIHFILIFKKKREKNIYRGLSLSDLKASWSFNPTLNQDGCSTESACDLSEGSVDSIPTCQVWY
jgi:hypothetical protein